MKQFDDIFRENVKKAFNSYNADHLADEGWYSFAGRKQNRKRHTALIPFWARAASIVVLIGLGVFIALKVSKRQITKDSIFVAESAVKTDEVSVTPYDTAKEVLPLVPESVEKTTHKGEKTRIAEKQQIYHGEDSVVEQKILNNESIINTETEKRLLISPNYVTVPVPSGIFNDFSTEIKPDDLILTDITPDDFKQAGKKSDMEKPLKERTLLAGLSGLIAQGNGYASPVSGLSVGFYLDQKLTKKISFRPGFALAFQSVGLENGNNQEVYSKLVAFNSGKNVVPYSYEGKMDMLAMELPLNLVFRIIERKRSGFYISAGASTLFYISQQFTANLINEYTQDNYSSVSATYLTETHYSNIGVERDYGAFSKTDFLGLANLSAGYSFPYSKTGTMLIEPFIQLPVNNLTSLDRKIRYAGVSMKLKFGKPDKEK